MGAEEGGRSTCPPRSSTSWACRLARNRLGDHADASEAPPRTDEACTLVILLTESGDSVSSTVTAEDGYFSVTSPEPGSFRLRAWAMGYGEAEEGVFELGMRGELTVEFRMAADPLWMDSILGALDRPVLEHALVRNGFLRRYRRNTGGLFLTPHDVETSPTTSTEDRLGRPAVGCVRGPRLVDDAGKMTRVRKRRG